MKRSHHTLAVRAGATRWRFTAALPLLVLALACVVTRAQPGKPELIFQTGHTFPINVAVFSPDGTLIASGGMDNSVKLWEAVTGREVRSLHGHANEVTLLAFSPDGRRLASGSQDSVKIWEVESGRLLRGFGNRIGVRGLAFSPDGSRLAAGDGPLLRQWNLTTEGEPLVIKPAGFLYDIAYSRDGKWLAVGGLRHVRVFDAATGAEARSWEAHPRRRVTSLSFSRDGRLLATGSSDKTAKVWEFETGREVMTFAGAHQEELTSVAFSPDAKSLVTTAGFDKVGVVWDVQTGSSRHRLDLHQNAVKSATFHPNGHWLLTASYDRRMILWDAETGRPQRPYHGFINESRSVAFSDDGRWLVIGNSDATVRWWDTALGKVSRTVQSGKGAVWDVDFSGDGRLLASASSDGSARVHEVSTGRELFVLSGHTGRVICVAFSPDDRLVATGSEDGAVKVWDATGQALRTFRAGEGLQVRSISFSRDGRLLASASWRPLGTSELVLWDIESGRAAHTWPSTEADGHFTAAAFSPDGKVLAATQGGKTRLIDLNSRQDVGVFEGGVFPTHLLYSRDGRLLASVDSIGRLVSVRDVASGEVRAFRHAGMVLDAAFSPKADLLASVGVDGSVRLWDTASGNQLLQLATVSEGNGWLAATGDGLFDGTAGVMQYASWRPDGSNSLVSLDTFYNDYYHPGLMIDVAEGRRPVASIDIATALQLPGLRTMLKQRLAHIMALDDKTVVCFRDEPTTLNISLLSDGKPISVSGFDFVPADPTCSYRKVLPVPAAQLDLLNEAPAKSVPGRAAQGGAASGVKTETARATLHVLTVAVSQYPSQSAARPLPFAVSGAQAVGDFFLEQQRSGAAPFARVRVWPHLYDAEATRGAILRRLAQMAREVNEGDVVFLFFSGHGTVPAGQEMFYFVPADGLGPDPDARRRTGLNTAMLADALRDMPARRLVLVIDACQSGGAVESLAKIGEVKSKIEARRQRARGQTATAQAEVGTYIIAAASPLQYALQPKSLGNGPLVAALLEALKGKPGSGVTSVADLVEHIRRRTPEISKEFSGAAAPLVQTPLIVSNGVDFAIANKEP